MFAKTLRWVVTELRENTVFLLLVLVQFTKVAEVCVLVDNIGKGYFLTGQFKETVDRYQTFTKQIKIIFMS